MLKRFIACTVSTLALAAGNATAADVFAAGRDLEEGRDFSMRAGFGYISDVQAAVKETTRRLYDVTGSASKQFDAEDYDLNDFGMDEGYPLLGLSMEKSWKYFTFQCAAAVMQPDTDTVAQRNYYIEVGDDIAFGGRKYDHLKIPEGTPFSVDLTAGLIELRGLVTPFTFRPADNVRLTPWINVGLFGFFGKYDIDAGPVQGVTQYQDPPEDFVVGGESSGYGGLGLPEWGLGGELRFGAEDGAQLVVQGDYSMCEYDGSTRNLTINDHREKDVDLDHVNVRGRILLEIPLRSARCLSLGIQAQSIESEALISSASDDPAEILARRERFDKEVEFRLEFVEALIGFTF